MKIDTTQNRCHYTKITSSAQPVNEFSEFFRGIGTFPWEYHFTFFDDATPIIHVSRKYPIAKRSLREMRTWQIAGFRWSKGSRSNQTSHRTSKLGLQPDVQLYGKWKATYLHGSKGSQSSHQVRQPETPILKEITHNLAEINDFRRLDATTVYYPIVLDHASSLLMTFNSPSGQFGFLQLPFGLTYSQDAFNHHDSERLCRNAKHCRWLCHPLLWWWHSCRP